MPKTKVNAGNIDDKVVRADAAGNVGIGKSLPAYKLDVNGSAQIKGTIFISGVFDGTARLVFLPDTGGNTWELYPSTDGIGLFDRTNGLYRMYILNNGNVGIGVTNPNRRLVIKGDLGFAYSDDDSASYNGVRTKNTWLEFFNGITGGFTNRIYSFVNNLGNSIFSITNGGHVKIGGGVIDGTAALDIESTTGGVLFPRMTTAQRNAIVTPADGLVIYNITVNKLQVRAAGVWVDLH